MNRVGEAVVLDCVNLHLPDFEGTTMRRSSPGRIFRSWEQDSLRVYICNICGYVEMYCVDGLYTAVKEVERVAEEETGKKR